MHVADAFLVDRTQRLAWLGRLRHHGECRRTCRSGPRHEGAQPRRRLLCLLHRWHACRRCRGRGRGDGGCLPGGCRGVPGEGRELRGALAGDRGNAVQQRVGDAAGALPTRREETLNDAANVAAGRVVCCHAALRLHTAAADYDTAACIHACTTTRPCRQGRRLVQRRRGPQAPSSHARPY